MSKWEKMVEFDDAFQGENATSAQQSASQELPRKRQASEQKYRDLPIAQFASLESTLGQVRSKHEGELQSALFRDFDDASIKKGGVTIAQFASLELTLDRVRKSCAGELQSALLREVDGASIEKVDKKLLLLLAALGLSFGLLLFSGGNKDLQPMAIFLILLGITFLAIWFFNRSVLLIIYAGSLRIAEKVGGGNESMSSAEGFIDALEETKRQVHDVESRTLERIAKITTHIAELSAQKVDIQE